MEESKIKRVIDGFETIMATEQKQRKKRKYVKKPVKGDTPQRNTLESWRSLERVSVKEKVGGGESYCDKKVERVGQNPLARQFRSEKREQDPIARDIPNWGSLKGNILVSQKKSVEGERVTSVVREEDTRKVGGGEGYNSDRKIERGSQSLVISKVQSETRGQNPIVRDIPLKSSVQSDTLVSQRKLEGERDKTD